MKKANGLESLLGSRRRSKATRADARSERYLFENPFYQADEDEDDDEDDQHHPEAIRDARMDYNSGDDAIDHFLRRRR